MGNPFEDAATGGLALTSILGGEGKIKREESAEVVPPVGKKIVL